MTSILATALLGLFLYSNASGVVADTNPQPVTYHVAMTGYNAVPAQTDDTPYSTASGALSDPDVVAARSADLADELPFGTVIQVMPATSTPNCGAALVNDFIGLRVVADSMNVRKHNQIDILFHSDDFVKVGGVMVNPALALGMCKDVAIRVVGKIDVKNMPHTQAELQKMIGGAPSLALAK